MCLIRIPRSSNPNAVKMGSGMGQASNFDGGKERNLVLAEQLPVFRRLPAEFAGMGGIA
jgi:hypothetical protein